MARLWNVLRGTGISKGTVRDMQCNTILWSILWNTLLGDRHWPVLSGSRLLNVLPGIGMYNMLQVTGNAKLS